MQDPPAEFLSLWQLTIYTWALSTLGARNPNAWIHNKCHPPPISTVFPIKRILRSISIGSILNIKIKLTLYTLSKSHAKAYSISLSFSYLHFLIRSLKHWFHKFDHQKFFEISILNGKKMAAILLGFQMVFGQDYYLKPPFSLKIQKWLLLPFLDTLSPFRLVCFVWFHQLAYLKEGLNDLKTFWDGNADLFILTSLTYMLSLRSLIF